MPQTLHPSLDPALEPSFNQTIEKDFRKARVDHNDIPGAPPFRVAMHTFYLGRWYYDGSREFATIPECVAFRDQWLERQAT